MINRDVWSLSLGRWGGVHIRLHIFFVLFAVFTAYLASVEEVRDDGLVWLALLSIAILFVSVLLHELGHYVAAVRLGGHMDALVLGPLGGLKPARVPKDPQRELLAVLAGPAVTLGICLFFLLFATILDAATSNLEPGTDRQLWQPLGLNFVGHVAGRGEISVNLVVRLTCWINWWLFVVNLIPAFPFDGGRAFSAFIQVMRPKLDPERAVVLVAAFARLVAVTLFLLAFVFRDAFPGSAVPSWLALVLLAVFVFFSARVEESHSDREDEEHEMFGYDFSQGYTSLEKSTFPAPPTRPGPLTSWLDRRRENRRVRQAATEAYENRKADEILKRLHEHGMDSLSPAEKALLKRVSVRLRSREQKS